MMEYLRRYMFVPGKIENIVVLVDLKNLGMAQVPIKALKRIYSVLSHHYIVRVFRFYICNMSWGLSSIVNLVKPMLTDRQRQKMVFLKTATECTQWAAAHHLEEDFGGSRPKITEFFPFPLIAGPFEVSCKSGPRKDAVPNVHKALAATGFRGRLWDPSKSHEENTQFEYADEAKGIFNACNMPLPANCPRKVKEAEPAPAFVQERGILKPLAKEGEKTQKENFMVSWDANNTEATDLVASTNLQEFNSAASYAASMFALSPMTRDHSSIGEQSLGSLTNQASNTSTGTQSATYQQASSMHVNVGISECDGKSKDAQQKCCTLM